MSIPTEAIGSIPRPAALQSALAKHAEGGLSDAELTTYQQQATAETLSRLAALGSPVLVDGEQAKPSFATYPVAGLATLAPDGAVIPFADGHTRQLPVLTAGPFRYQVHAESYLREARRHTELPVKQAVIAPSALSLLYPAEPIEGYSREQFLADLVDEAEADIRGCLDAGAHAVQLDFTEGRLSLKLDPSGGLLDDFIALNNRVLERFSDGRAGPDRRAHLPRRRPRLHPQRRRRLRGPAARPSSASRRAPSTSSWPASPTASRVLERHRRAPAVPAPGCSSGSPTDRPLGGDRRAGAGPGP